jgi:surfactin family lipopeptide synthetase A
MVPSLAMVRAILAVLKAGAACLMLDPALPRERIAAILAVSDPRAVITQERFLSALSATNTPAMVCGEDAADLPCSWPQEYPTRRFTPAYAVASFCETGSLSIVVRTHKAVLARLGAVQEISPVGHGDSILQNRNSSLDVWELLWLLSHGAQVVIRPAPEEANPDRARQSIGRENITRTQVVPLLPQRLPVGARRSELRSLRASLWTSERPGVHRRKACND